MKPRRRRGKTGRDFTARNKHHLTPRSRGGDESPENLLLLKLDRHFYWHKLFGTKTLEEVILLLQRVHRAKGRCLYAKTRRPMQRRVLSAGSCHQIKSQSHSKNGGKPLGVSGGTRNAGVKKVPERQRP
jgi:hypothetical protein